MVCKLASLRAVNLRVVRVVTFDADVDVEVSRRNVMQNGVDGRVSKWVVSDGRQLAVRVVVGPFTLVKLRRDDMDRGGGGLGSRNCRVNTRREAHDVC